MVTKHRADLPVLCGCFPLAIYFTFGSVYMSMPLSHFVPAYPSPSPCPQVHSLVGLRLYSRLAPGFFRATWVLQGREILWPKAFFIVVIGTIWGPEWVRWGTLEFNGDRQLKCDIYIGILLQGEYNIIQPFQRRKLTHATLWINLEDIMLSKIS